MLFNTIDVCYTEDIEVRLHELETGNVALTFVNKDLEFSIIMNKKIAKSVHNVTRKLYPSYAVESDKEKVTFVFETDATPTSELQTFLKGLKLNEVIV